MGIAAPISDVFQGNAQSSQYKTEAALAERQAQDVDLQAAQSSEVRRGTLRAAMAAIEARRAASGLSLDSPTAQAIQREFTRMSVRDEGAEKVGFNNQRYSLTTQAAMKRKAAKTAQTMGWFNAAADTGKMALEVAGAG